LSRDDACERKSQQHGAKNDNFEDSFHRDIQMQRTGYGQSLLESGAGGRSLMSPQPEMAPVLAGAAFEAP
jgi:hypothetical protein